MGGFFGGNVTGFTLKITDRQYGPAAGNNATGNNVVMIGTGAGAGATPSGLVILGTGAGAAGFSGSALAGSVIIGDNAAPALTAPSSSSTRSVTVIGYNAANAETEMSGMVVIGDYALYQNNNTATSDSVVIGSYACAYDSYQVNDSVVIGTFAGGNTSLSGVGGISSSVVVGGFAVSNRPDSTQMGGCVVIGGLAANVLGGDPENNVIIGYQCAVSMPSGSYNTLIGAAISAGGAPTNAVAIGQGASASGTGNITIGYECCRLTGLGDLSIILGSQAGSTLSGSPSYLFLVESYDGATVRRAMASRMDLGNTYLGNSTAGLDLSDGSNCTKLFNGTKSSTAPTGGGYFYVNAGALHWVGSSGTDTTLASA